MGKGAAAASTKSTSLVLIVMLLLFSVSFTAVQGVPAETGKPAARAVKSTEPHAGAKRPHRQAITKETEEAQTARLIANAMGVLEQVEGTKKARAGPMDGPGKVEPPKAAATKATQVKERNTESWKRDDPRPQGMMDMRPKMAPKLPRA